MRKLMAVVGSLALLALAVVVISALGSSETRTQIGGITLVQEARAAAGDGVREAAARDSALEVLEELQPGVQGLRVREAKRAPGLLRAQDATGRIIHESSTGADAWVIAVDGPSAGEYEVVIGLVVIDAATGEVSSAQLLQTNE